MSKYRSSGDSPPRKRKTRQPRSLSASEIARNAKHFDTWSTYQGCESVAFSDLPKEFEGLVNEVFDTPARLPRAWVDKTTDVYAKLHDTASPELINFLSLAYDSCPDLFSDSDALADAASLRLFDDLRGAFLAWDRLRRLRESQAKISEATMAANVYEVLRSPAAASSLYRSKCSISLAQPLPHLRVTTQVLRILNASTVIPDAALFVPSMQLHDLSHSMKSPFKKLRRSPLTGSAGRTNVAFAAQATPCAQLPALPAFEFAASFWEDKKPMHLLLEDAYRQNRMSTAAAARQLHSLHVRAPLFGLIWADGVVRAHVDWASGGWQDNPIVHSAPYPGPHKANSAPLFYEWHIDDPAGALKIFLLIRNLDAYTTGTFVDCVRTGVRDLEQSVDSGVCYRPWKRAGLLSATPLQDKHMNTDVRASGNSSAEHTPEKRKMRRTRRKAQSSSSGSC